MLLQWVVVGTDVGGVETAKDGVVVDTGSPGADMVARHAAVGRRMPAEDDLLRSFVDCGQPPGAEGQGILRLSQGGKSEE